MYRGLVKNWIPLAKGHTSLPFTLRCELYEYILYIFSTFQISFHNCRSLFLPGKKKKTDEMFEIKMLKMMR